MRYLRQSTASQSRAIGPFVDDTDFKTEETGLTIANTDIKLIVNGGASANKTSGGGTHRANGVYGVTFDATDTATVGEMRVSVKVAGALAVWETFCVLEEAIYDALFAAAAAAFDANQRVAVGAFATGAITSGAFAAGAIDAAAIATDAIGSAELAASATAEIAAAVWQDATAGDFTVASSIGKALYTGNVVPGAAGGHFIAGTNAPVVITGSGDALTLSSTGANGSGLAASGNGTGAGVKGTGGATGNGVQAVGGATSGSAIKASGTAGNAIALELAGQGSAAGLSATGGATGEGVKAVGGATSGSAVKASGTAGNATALELVGQGSGSGLKATGGATGSGALLTGGASSGPGLRAVGVADDGASFEGGGGGSGLAAIGEGIGSGIGAVSGTGAGGSGIFAQSQASSGAGDGIFADGSPTGKDIRGDIEGSVKSVAAGGIIAASFGVDAIDATALKADAVAEIWASATRTLTGSQGIKKNTAKAAFMFAMTDSTTHAPATGLTVTATRSLDGAAFASCANSVVEVASGWYKIDLAAADLNGDTVALKFTATGGDQLNISLVTSP